MTDQELAERVSIELKPGSGEGKRLAEALKKTALEYGSVKSPCSYTAYEGTLAGKKIKVDVVEKEANTFLLGPAALNDVYVYDGSVYGLPKDTSKLKSDVSKVMKKGLKLDFGFIDSISNYFAAEVEKQVKAGQKEGLIQIKMAKTPGEVNISIDDTARRFILSKNKQISIKGPVFTAVEYKVK
ncbi:MAG: hypothetical protein FJY77_04725 [Candidatus Altiarchaeales archaeon]|nr:hypothetical protein [Candidatus Altiarchaeales archaeon]